MNDTIYKYHLPITDDGRVEIPGDFTPLSLQMQGNCSVLWVRLDADSELMSVPYKVFGTGHPITGVDRMTYIGTVQVMSGLVFHYWMDVPPVVVH